MTQPRDKTTIRNTVHEISIRHIHSNSSTMKGENRNTRNHSNTKDLYPQSPSPSSAKKKGKMLRKDDLKDRPQATRAASSSSSSCSPGVGIRAMSSKAKRYTGYLVLQTEVFRYGTLKRRERNNSFSLDYFLYMYTYTRVYTRSLLSSILCFIKCESNCTRRKILQIIDLFRY